MSEVRGLKLSILPFGSLKIDTQFAMESKVKELTAARKFEEIEGLIAEEPASFMNDAIIQDIR
jgi:hypothetical protein